MNWYHAFPCWTLKAVLLQVSLTQWHIYFHTSDLFNINVQTHTLMDVLEATQGWLSCSNVLQHAGWSCWVINSPTFQLVDDSLNLHSCPITYCCCQTFHYGFMSIGTFKSDDKYMTTLALLCWHIEITWTSQCIYLFGYLIICHVYRQGPVHLTMTCPPKEIRRLHLPHWPSTAVFNMRPNIGWGIWEVLVLVRRQSSFRTIIRFRVS